MKFHIQEYKLAIYCETRLEIKNVRRLKNENNFIDFG